MLASGDRGTAGTQCGHRVRSPLSGAVWRPGWLAWSERGRWEGTVSRREVLKDSSFCLRQTLTYVQRLCLCGEQGHKVAKENGQETTSAVIQNRTVGAEGVRAGHVREMLSEDSGNGSEVHQLWCMEKE